jgi:hypothetical protein
MSAVALTLNMASFKSGLQNAYCHKNQHFHSPVLRAVRMLDRLCERIRYLYGNIRAEDAYVYWATAFS